MRILVDSPAFMDQFERDLAQATRSVAIHAMSFEGDQAGLRLARLLRDRHDLDRTLAAAWQSARRAASGTLGRAAVGLSRL